MPGLRIAVVNQKGGTGKTTLALNLAAGLQRRASTLVLDADPQASISQWAAMGGESGQLPVVQAVAQDDVRARIEQGARGHRYVVIDCPPTLRTTMVGDVMNNVDVLLVPIQPSPVDLWASMDITTAVHNTRQRNPQLKNFELAITPAVVRGRNFWRVSAGGFSQVAAYGMCSSVRSGGGGCFAYASLRSLPGTIPVGGQAGPLRARR